VREERCGVEIWQRLEVGDEIPMPGHAMCVERLDKERAMVVRSSNGAWVLSFELRPQNGRTRLISRNRFDTSAWKSKDWLGYAGMEPGSGVMERKTLRMPSTAFSTICLGSVDTVPPSQSVELGSRNAGDVRAHLPGCDPAPDRSLGTAAARCERSAGEEGRKLGRLLIGSSVAIAPGRVRFCPPVLRDLGWAKLLHERKRALELPALIAEGAERPRQAERLGRSVEVEADQHAGGPRLTRG
jgi:hypothetical protein